MANIINTGSTNCPFPVGYGGFFQSDPNSIYAGTTWEQKKDVFILASGDSYKTGATGGEATHTLTVDEMPSHTHDIASGVTYTSDATGNIQAVQNNSYFHYTNSYNTKSAGGGQAHNNMPPYYSMPFWIRTE